MRFSLFTGGQVSTNSEGRQLTFRVVATILNAVTNQQVTFTFLRRLLHNSATPIAVAAMGDEVRHLSSYERKGSQAMLSVGVSVA